jgi:hypothetical protein
MLPFLVKHALYPLHETLLRRPTFAQTAQLEKTQWLSRVEIEALQLERLASLLRTARRQPPRAHSEAGINQRRSHVGSVPSAADDRAGARESRPYRGSACPAGRAV